MAALSNTFVNKTIDWLFRAQAIGLGGASAGAGTGPTTLWVAAYTVMPTASTAGTEVTGGAYARVAVTSSLANWAGTQGAGTTAVSSGSSNVTSNNNPVTFPAPTGSNYSGPIVGFAICDAVSGGNIVAFGTQTPNKTVNNGDPAPSFAAGALTFSLN